MTRRIVLSILLTCWTVLLAGGTVAYVALRNALLADLDESLALRASLLPEVLGVDAGRTAQPLPPGDRYVIRNQLGQTLARPGAPNPNPDRLPTVRDGTFATLADGGRVRTVTLSFPGSGGREAMTVTYSGSAERYDRLVGRLWLVCGVVALAAGVVTSGAAVLAARSTLRPLNAVADTITAIDERSLDRRFDVMLLPTELRPMAERLNQMLARLEQGVRQQETFMADAAHELRTPVTALMTGIEVALRRPRDAAALKQVLEECLADVRVLRRLIESLLDHFRSHAAGQATAAAGPVDVSALLDLCVDSARSFGRHKAVDVAKSYAPDVRFDTNPQKLRSIVSNLLHNAIEYNVPGGSVELSCGVAGDELAVAVRDTGRGIPAELLPRVFEPFHRGAENAADNGAADNAAADNGGARGLGLFLIKTHVEALGGTYGVRTAAGQGSEFRFRLPRQTGVLTVV